MTTFFFGARIDARGHIREVAKGLFAYEEPPTERLRWFKLDGTELAYTEYKSTFPANLRIDARGHVVAVQQYIGEPGGETAYRWYDLDGNELSAGGTPARFVRNLRIDARGHVREVQMDDEIWYDLNGEIAA